MLPYVVRVRGEHSTHDEHMMVTWVQLEVAPSCELLSLVHGS